MTSTNQDRPRIECRSLEKRLASGSEMLAILSRVDLSIAPGEFVAILGPSGSGKSTLLGLMAGLDRPSSGEVRIDGTRLDDLDEDGLALLRRRKIGFVFQSFQLLSNLTAEENVLLPLELGGFPGGRGAARSRAREMLARVGLEARAHHYPAQLSGGEQQRVALARAFGPRPAILFADEPTGNLDAETGRRVLDLVDAMHADEGATLVLVTHDAAVAARAGRRVHLADGRIVRDERTPVVAQSNAREKSRPGLGNSQETARARMATHSPEAAGAHPPSASHPPPSPRPPSRAGEPAASRDGSGAREPADAPARREDHDPRDAQSPVG